MDKTNKTSGKERFKLGQSVIIENAPQNLLPKDGVSFEAEEQKFNDLLESRQMKEKLFHFSTSDMVKNSRNEANRCSTMIENLEAILGPSTGVIPQTMSISETIYTTVADKPITLVVLSENENLRRNSAHLPSSETLLDSNKALKTLNGAIFYDGSKHIHIEEKYQINMKMFKSQINKLFKKAIDEGMLEKSSRINAEGRYKV